MLSFFSNSIWHEIITNFKRQRIKIDYNKEFSFLVKSIVTKISKNILKNSDCLCNILFANLQLMSNLISILIS